MCSIVDSTPVPVTVPGLARLVAHLREAAVAVSGAIAADPALLAELGDETLESFALDLHAAVDSASAAATVVTGRLDREVGSVRGKLLAGRFPSTARFLEVAAGLSPEAARAAVARGRDLDSHSTPVADAWLAGQITGGAVRDLTAGVSDVIRRSARSDTPVTRAEALDHLLPIAREGDLRRLRRAGGEMRLRLDPDGTTEDALFAFENQSLSITEAGSMYRITGWLTPETAAATRTVLEAGARQITEQQLGDLTHDPDCDTHHLPGAQCTCGEVDRARRAAGLRHDQLYALALGEVMTDRLDDATLGSHHRVAPHLTVVADVTDAAGPMLGRLAIPGHDHDAPLPAETLNRLLCDADVTRVLTTTLAAPAEPGEADGREQQPPHDQDEIDAAPASSANEPGPTAGEAYLQAVITSLEAIARSVLYVGRHERTVTSRLRRALQVRDGHCVFPGCRAHARRCHAHHVRPWQHGGATDLPNMALLCVTHHVAVHEGGWTMALRPGTTGHETGCWDFTAPPLTRRRRPRP